MKKMLYLAVWMGMSAPVVANHPAVNDSEWYDLIQYAQEVEAQNKAIATVTHSAPQLQQELMKEYNITQQDIDKTVKHPENPQKDLFANFFAWKMVPSARKSVNYIDTKNSYNQMCQRAVLALQENFWSRRHTPEQLAAVLAQAQECLQKKESKIAALVEQRGRTEAEKSMAGWYSGKIDQFREKNPSIEAAATVKESDLPASVKEPYKEYSQLKKEKNAINESRAQAICKDMERRLKILYYDTTHSNKASSRHKDDIIQLLQVSQLCEKLNKK